jgi:hypothetical protein
VLDSNSSDDKLLYSFAFNFTVRRYAAVPDFLLDVLPFDGTRAVGNALFFFHIMVSLTILNSTLLRAYAAGPPHPSSFILHRSSFMSTIHLNLSVKHLRWITGSKSTSGFTDRGGKSLNPVMERPVPLISSKSRVYLLKDRNPIGALESRSVEFSKWTVRIDRANGIRIRYHTFDTKPVTEFKLSCKGNECEALARDAQCDGPVLGRKA